MENGLRSRRARVFKALAHPVRLELVELLKQGPACVCELAARFPLGLPAVSKHLALLREAGVIRSQRDGTRILYRLVMPCMLESFSCIDRLILDQLRTEEGLRQRIEEELPA